MFLHSFSYSTHICREVYGFLDICFTVSDPPDETESQNLLYEVDDPRDQKDCPKISSMHDEK